MKDLEEVIMYYNYEALSLHPISHPYHSSKLTNNNHNNIVLTTGNNYPRSSYRYIVHILVYILILTTYCTLYEQELPYLNHQFI